MNKVARKGLVTAAVVGGVLASAGFARADSTAGGDAVGSPGVLSGNAVQAPVHAPVNVCGNTVDAVGALNPAFGQKCVNASDEGPPTPRPTHTAPPVSPAPPSHPPIPAPPNTPVGETSDHGTTLAHTGTQGAGYAAGAGALLLLGGTVLRRRSRTRRR
jgi:LPXTG-motif cell wall-anchored protein